MERFISEHSRCYYVHNLVADLPEIKRFIFFFNIGLDSLRIATLCIYHNILATMENGSECSEIQNAPLVAIDIEQVLPLCYESNIFTGEQELTF